MESTNRFTGWVDVDLSEKGIEEAKRAGGHLSAYTIDHLYTSVLMRAEKTAAIALEAAGQTDVPKTRHEALNERHYGALQGLNKDETREKYGKEQVHQWRRSFDVNPPEGESLSDTCDRVLPYYRANILPKLKGETTLLVAAHGNSLRALIKDLEQLSADERKWKCQRACQSFTPLVILGPLPTKKYWNKSFIGRFCHSSLCSLSPHQDFSLYFQQVHTCDDR